jgi:bifunctional DNA-binding transcriptional regulator/antitoxin component of YhaV-PrlF toxin-antitoxin module
MRHALGIKAGDEVVMRLEAGEIRLVALRDSVRHAREMFRRHVPASVPVVDELIASRRQEAVGE